MNPRAVHVRIGRLVLDAPLAASMPADALADAVRAALMTPHGAAQQRRPDSPRGSASPLAGAIATGIADRLGAMNVDAKFKRSGGRDGAF